MVTYTGIFSGRVPYALTLYVTPGAYNIATNQTLVSWSMHVDEQSRWGSWRLASDSTWSVNVGGLTGSGTWNYDWRASGADRALGSGSGYITHNSDGTKSISITANANGNYPLGTASISQTLGLARIPRGPRVRWSGVWRNTVLYVRHAGTWRIAIPYVRFGGTWRNAGS